MKLRLVVLLAGALATLSAGAYFVWRPVSVPVESPRTGPVRQTVVVSGQVMPPAEVRLASFVSSAASEVAVVEGELVKQGQLLLRLDDADAQARLEQAKASLASAKAGRNEVARIDGPHAETQLRSAETNLKEARRRLVREQNLFNAGVTAQELLDDAKAAEELASAQRDAAQLQLRAASSGGSQSARARAAVALAEAQLAAAKIQLARHAVRAPVDGVIVTRRVEKGDAVLSGSSLFVLSQTGATRLRIEPDERNLALLRLGQRAVVSAEAFPGDRFTAEVQYIAPAVDPTRGTVEVHLMVASPPSFLRQNMTVSVEIVVAEKDNALLVSRASVAAERSEPYVLTLSSRTTGKVQKTPVTLGFIGDSVVEIQDGLSAADLVLSGPAGAVLPGDRARAAHDPASAASGREAQ